jgi:hypothetical protein
LRDALIDVAITPLGVSAVIRADTPAAAERTRRDWSRCLADPDDTVDAAFSIPLGGDGASDASQYTTTTTLTFGLIDHLTGRLLMLHAGGVSDDHGRVLALVAPSGGGKSTAVRTLAHETFGYVTDETVGVHDDGAVDPYAKPLAFVVQNGNTRTKIQRGPDELGLRPCAARLRLGRVVLLSRTAESVTPTLEPVALLDAMLDLIPHTSALPALPRPLQQLAEALARVGGAFRLRYTEVRDTAPLLTDLLSGEPGRTEIWEVVDRPPPTPPLLFKDGRWAAASWQDAIRVDDEVLVLLDGVPMRLAGIGVTIWDAIRAGAQADGLVDIVTGHHGAHPDAAQFVAAATQALLEAGALVHRAPMTVQDVLAGKSSDDVPSANTAPADPLDSEVAEPANAPG